MDIVSSHNPIASRIQESSIVFQKLFAAAFMALGIFDNVIIYSYLLKRRTSTTSA